MKIGIITTSYPAYKGHLQSPFIHSLAEALAKDGNQVKVVCPYYGNFSKKNEHMDKVEVFRFQYFPLKFQKLTEGGGMPSALKASFIAKINMPFFILCSIFKSLKELKNCDIIHCQWALAGVSGIFVKKIFKKPMILTTRGAEFDLALKNFIFKNVLKYILKNSDYITPNNESHIETIKKFGILEDKITAVPNGVDLNNFRPRDQKQIRERMGLSFDKKIILFVGWLIERKGVNYLLEAASRLEKERKDVLFLIIGSGILEKELKEQAKNLNNVNFAGPKDTQEICYWMNSADIFVLPSLSEGRPNVVAEALSSGLPVIATNVNGTPELIDDHKTGFLIPIRDPNSIYEKIRILLDDDKLRMKMSKDARRLVLTKVYDWDKCARDYIKIYNKVLK